MNNKVMTQEDKKLLLKDLNARLTYGVIINVHDTFPCTTLPYFNMCLTSFDSISSFIEPIFKTKDKLIRRILKEHAEYLEFKPYLRPISSMSEDESSELEELTDGWFYHDTDDDCNDVIYPIGQHSDSDSFEFIIRGINWLNANHFDYQNLIEKGLALEAPEGMYNK